MTQQLVEVEAKFEIGELVTLSTPVAGVDARRICQVIGFRKQKLRLLPLGGIPVLVELGQVARCDLPAGSNKPPQRKRRWRKPKPKAKAA